MAVIVKSMNAYLVLWSHFDVRTGSNVMLYKGYMISQNHKHDWLISLDFENTIG